MWYSTHSTVTALSLQVYFTLGQCYNFIARLSASEYSYSCWSVHTMVALDGPQNEAMTPRGLNRTSYRHFYLIFSMLSKFTHKRTEDFPAKYKRIVWGLTPELIWITTSKTFDVKERSAGISSGLSDESDIALLSRLPWLDLGYLAIMNICTQSVLTKVCVALSLVATDHNAYQFPIENSTAVILNQNLGLPGGQVFVL